MNKVCKSGIGKGLPCSLSKLWLALWVLLMWVTDGIQYHPGMDEGTITVDFVAELSMN
jgi:hypothetical protein